MTRVESEAVRVTQADWYREMQWGAKPGQGLARIEPVAPAERSPKARNCPEQAGVAGHCPVTKHAPVKALAAGNSPVHGHVTAPALMLGSGEHAEVDCTTVSATVTAVKRELTVTVTVTISECGDYLLLFWLGGAGGRSVSSAQWTFHECPVLCLHSSGSGSCSRD